MTCRDLFLSLTGVVSVAFVSVHALTRDRDQAMTALIVSAACYLLGVGIERLHDRMNLD